MLEEGVLGEGFVRALMLCTYVYISRCWILKRFSRSVWHFKNLKCEVIQAKLVLGDEGIRSTKLLP